MTMPLIVKRLILLILIAAIATPLVLFGGRTIEKYSMARLENKKYMAALSEKWDTLTGISISDDFESSYLELNSNEGGETRTASADDSKYVSKKLVVVSETT